MRKFQLGELLHKPGPEEALDYLWGRLQDRDLSEDEALALLSAVHSELSSRRADPKMYFAYSRFMESLSKDMPVVHDYVVANWVQSRRRGRETKRAQSESPAEPGAEDGQERPPQETPLSTNTRGAAAMPHLSTNEGPRGDEPAEAGEPDESDEETRPRAASREDLSDGP